MPDTKFGELDQCAVHRRSWLRLKEYMSKCWSVDKTCWCQNVHGAHNQLAQARKQRNFVTWWLRVHNMNIRSRKYDTFWTSKCDFDPEFRDKNNGYHEKTCFGHQNPSKNHRTARCVIRETLPAPQLHDVQKYKIGSGWPDVKSRSRHKIARRIY